MDNVICTSRKSFVTRLNNDNEKEKMHKIEKPTNVNATGMQTHVSFDNLPRIHTVFPQYEYACA